MLLEAKAIARWVRIAPRKMRLVADMVRGLGIRSAMNKLHFSTKHASEPVEKTIRSALSNLMVKDDAKKLDPGNVFIREIRVDEGPILKRWKPRAQGRATRIRKRTSHLTVVVGAEVESGK